MALREALRSRGDVEVAAVDLFQGPLSALATLAALASSRQGEFFSPGMGQLSELNAARPDDAVLREVTRAMPAVTDLLAAESFDAVIAVAPLAAAVSAESGCCGFVAGVVPRFSLADDWFHPGVDMWFVPGPEVRDELLLLGVPWERISVSGVPVKRGGAPAVGEARVTLGAADRFTALLLAGPGADAAPVVADALLDAGFQVIAATERPGRVRRDLSATSRAGRAFLVCGEGEDMRTMMRASDVLVTMGEPALAEALAAGLPMVVVDAGEGRSADADFLVDAGAALPARDPADVVRRVRYLASHAERSRQLSENARSLDRPGATQAVCDRVVASMG